VPQQPFKRGLGRMAKLLKETIVGRLGLACDGEVYVIPINHCYVRGRLIFHCAFEGRKLDVMRQNPNVCFEVDRWTAEPPARGGRYHEICDAGYESVICWGRAREVTDVGERVRLLDTFQRHYEITPRERMTRDRAAKCNAFVIDIERMTGVVKHEGEIVFLEHNFPAGKRR
jgi:nitroimidazol reductase NimA-like FMN-containing flavoprotein (pyridoxamine 5'-phosphate oxidase superfamily)